MMGGESILILNLNAKLELAKENSYQAKVKLIHHLRHLNYAITKSKIRKTLFCWLKRKQKTAELNANMPTILNSDWKAIRKQEFS